MKRTLVVFAALGCTAFGPATARAQEAAPKQWSATASALATPTQSSATAGAPAPTAPTQGSRAARSQEEAPEDFHVYWRDGLRMETNDDRFQLRLGGRIQYDWVGWGDDSGIADALAVPVRDGTEFRRARFFVKGYVYERFEYKIQFDFAGGEAAIKDLYFGVRHPTFGFRMGHMKEPFSLEQLTSSKYITFIERGLPAVFDDVRNSGFLLHGNVLDGDFNYGVGVFRNTGDSGVSVARRAYNISGRFAGALINRNEGRNIVHVGASAVFQADEGDDRNFRSRPEVHLAPRFISSGQIPTKGATVVALEGAVVAGPFSAQAEYKVAPVNSAENGDPTFSGWYAYGSYFLTGESRPYADSLFERLRPRRNFMENGGYGAFEVAARFSSLDLSAEGIDKSDDPIVGTELDNLTLAFNWYWNPMTQMRINLVRADIVDVGAVWAFLWRGQIDF